MPGYQEPRAPVAEAPEDSFDRVFHTNTRSTWLGMKHALAHMLPQGSGAIVNCASVSGLRNPNPGLALYSASKAAVVSLTRSAAMEYAEKGVRINAVAPGRVVTDMMLGSKIMDMGAVAGCGAWASRKRWPKLSSGSRRMLPRLWSVTCCAPTAVSWRFEAGS